MPGVKRALGLVLLLASAVSAQDPDAFRQWLGPQTRDEGRLFAPVVGERIDPKTDHKLRRYDLSLKIVRGSDLQFEESANPMVTFEQNEFRQLKEFQPLDNALYLVGTMQLKKGARGWRFYTLNVRVKDGPLTGAVVHLRDGKIQNSIVDPCVALYRVPDGIDAEAADVSFDVVAQFSK